MTKLKTLKRELKAAKKDIRRNINVVDNEELIQVLQDEIKIKENLRLKGHKTSIYNNIIDKFGKYNPKIKLLDNVKYVGHKITRIRFDENKYDKQFFTIDKIQKIGNKMSHYLASQGLNGKIMATTNYGVLGWRSGYFSTIGDDVTLYEPYDSGIEIEIVPQIKSFVIYVVINPKPQGGNDLLNDCLYDCLKKMIYDIDKYFKSPEALKKHLGLERSAKIPLESIPQIEQKLKTYQINIRGDYIYTSSIKSEKVINLLLQNEHYEIDKTFNKKPLCKYISFKEKLPLLYDKVTFEAYDGCNIRKLSKEERNEILTSFKSPYILINREEQKYLISPTGEKVSKYSVQKSKVSNIDDYREITLKEEYDEFIKIANTLKRETNGYINLYKTGSYKKAALDLFDRFTKFLNEPEDILQDEGLWIKEASTSALIWAEPYTGELYKYDAKSLYPYLMTLSSTKFPIRRGEFQQLSEFGEFFQYGIYRCEIEKSLDPNINKLFKFCKTNYYTSVSLNHAKTLGLNIKLIHDSQPNFLYYSGDKTMKFSEIFSSFVNYMFELKEKGIEKSKTILNILWGALSEINKIKYYDNKEVNIGSDEELFQLRPCAFDENVDVITTNKINNRYKTNYARLCPFLLANGRFHMSKIMFENKDFIHRISTDGFLCEKQIHNNIDVGLGELRYEGFTECGEIINCMNKVPVHF